MKDEKTFLKNALTDNQLDVPAEIQDKMLQYLHLMKKWNAVHNLTSIDDPYEMIMLHIIDSLSINRFVRGERVIDIGTGAGLPGIPLALIHPEKKFVLLDSNNKKITFLNQVLIELKLQNVELIHLRAEDFHPMTCFNTVMTRAFSSLKEMLKASGHLVCEEGMFLAMKGAYPEVEIQEVPDEFHVTSIHALRINGLNAERHLVLIEKA